MLRMPHIKPVVCCRVQLAASIEHRGSRMSKKINKHGLTRTIPPTVRAMIRKEAGYGCVFCGNPFVDYEHIDPEFKDAKTHDPDKMTLLCSGCHDNVTQGRWSKRCVWEAKTQPFAKKEGFIRNTLSPAQDKAVIKMGDMRCSLSNIVLSMFGKPIIWFEPSHQPEAPIFLNAIFHDNNSKPIAYISRNIFRGIVGEHDIVSTAARFEFRLKKGVITLIIESKGDEPVEIKRLHMGYLGQEIVVSSDGGVRLKWHGGETVFNGGSISGFGTGFSLGSVPSTRRDQFGVFKKVTLAMALQARGRDVISFNGSKIAWQLGQFILTKSYEIVGVIANETEVSSISGEYIGQLITIKSSDGKTCVLIGISDDEYTSGEPIWIAPFERKVNHIKVSDVYDVGHRFNPQEKCYCGDSSLREFIQSFVPDVDRAAIGSPMDDRTIEAQRIASNGPASLGDHVTVDFVGHIDGAAFTGGTAENFQLTLGSGRMISGFEEGIIGAQKGARIQVPVRFPQEYHADNLRGREAVFHIYVREIFKLAS